MSDIRLITIQDDGEVQLTPHRAHIPLTPKEEAVQRFIICLLNTPGTMVNAPGWGGGLQRLFLSTREASLKATKQRLNEIIQDTENSLVDTEPGGPYRIVNLNVSSVERVGRGIKASVRIDFADAFSTTVKIPGKSDVIS